MRAVHPTGRSGLERGVPILIAAIGVGLWMLHAEAWSLGRRSPVLGFDAAQYAVAARELAESGRLATRFALPIELARHPSPPWPLAVVQPGLVVAEALIERTVPARVGPLEFREPHQRERLMLLLPLACFLAIGALLALLTSRLLRDHAPALPAGERALAAAVVGLLFVLDPEAQHFATGGFTELPFTLGLIVAIAGIALGWAPRRPLLYGLLLGVAGSFRGNMLWLAPIFAGFAAAGAAPGTRRRVLLLALAGFALPLAPWWFYKWRSFGSPAWDLSALGVWDGVSGRTWFSLTHLPQAPDLPSPLAAAPALMEKLGRNLGRLLAALFSGFRGLWIGALVVWIAIARPRPALRHAALALLATAALGLLVAAMGASWLRYLFPARVPLEAAGLLALLALVGRVPATLLRDGARRVVRVAIVLAALAWGFQQTARGNAEARAAVESRGLPGVASLRDLAARVNREVAAGEPLMSNLGPTLAWYAARPVLHLSLRPEDMEACRRRIEFRHVVLAFRDSAHAWRGWDAIVARPEVATARPEWNVIRVRSWDTADGIRVVWMELGPAPLRLAGGASSPRRW